MYDILAVNRSSKQKLHQQKQKLQIINIYSTHRYDRQKRTSLNCIYTSGGWVTTEIDVIITWFCSSKYLYQQKNYW